MRKSIYLLTTTPSSHTHRFHPLPLATPTSCSPHPLATPIHSTHSPQLSYRKNFFFNEQKVGMLLQKRTDTRGVGISSMRKSIYLLTTTPSSHTHRFHPLSTIVIHTLHKLKVWMSIVESGWNVCVWLVGAVSRRRVWLVGVGGIYGCVYWVWL